MAGIGDVIQVTITRNTRTPTRAGFGTPLLMAYHTRFPELYRVYEELSDMESDGFVSRDPAYRMAQALLSQSPRPERFVVGRLPAAHTHTQEVTITSAVEGEVVELSVVSPTTGDVTEISYTIPAAATTTTVATAVELLVEAVAGVTAASAAAVITITPDTNGNIVYVYGLQNATIKDITADAAYDTALSALDLATPSADSWYTVHIDVASKANLDDVAAWAETRVKLFIGQTINSEEAAGTGALLTNLRDLGYDRTAMVYHPNLHQYPAVAWAGRTLPEDAGSITWAMKELIGVTPTQLTPTQESNLETASANFYVEVGGLNMVDGKNGGGIAVGGEYLDIMHGTDWFTARLQEEGLAYLANQGKVTYEDSTGDTMEALVLAVLGAGVDRKLFTRGSLTATATKVANISSADRAARVFGPIKFGATYAGAVHKVRFQGTLSL